MQTPAFSTLPSVISNGAVLASSAGDRVEDAGDGSPFAALLGGHDPLAAVPAFTAGTTSLPKSTSVGATKVVPTVADTGKTLPLPGKDAVNASKDEEILPVCEVIFDFGVLIPTSLFAAPGKADVVGTNAPAAEQNLAGGNGTLALTASQAVLPTQRHLPTEATAQSVGVMPPSPTLPAQLDLVPVALTDAPGDGESASPTPYFSANPARASSAPSADPVANASGTVASSGPQAPTATIVSIVAPATVPAPKTEATVQSGKQEPATATTQAIGAQILQRTDVIGAAHGETPQDRRKGGGERAKASADFAPAIGRSPATDSIPTLTVVAAPMAERGAASATVPVAPATPIAFMDRAEAVASVVDRLVAARDAGVGALASVAIAHGDFGDITVNFSAKNDALEVSLAAEDQDKQRALAAALHTAERTALKDAAPSAPQPSHNGMASAQHERGSDAQLARDGGSRQPRGEATREEHRGLMHSDAGQSEHTTAEPSGIYV